MTMQKKYRKKFKTCSTKKGKNYVKVTSEFFAFYSYTFLHILAVYEFQQKSGSTSLQKIARKINFYPINNLTL